MTMVVAVGLLVWLGLALPAAVAVGRAFGAGDPERASDDLVSGPTT